jgi:hypothetical protein
MSSHKSLHDDDSERCTCVQVLGVLLQHDDITNRGVITGAFYITPSLYDSRSLVSLFADFLYCPINASGCLPRKSSATCSRPVLSA